MITITGSKNFPAKTVRPVVAIGNFDGVHLGHAHLIREARKIAEGFDSALAVLTFDPHPVRILAPDECPPLIQTPKQKEEALSRLGVDCLVIERFTKDFAQKTPEFFFEEIIVQNLRARAVVIGYDFTFGLHRKGQIETMEALGNRYDVKICVISAQFLGETLVSSTNIRRLIEHGDVVSAAGLLGRPYIIDGTVVAGRGIGQTLGVRTANIESTNALIPMNGVYLTRTLTRADGAWHPSITSIGNNPTFPHSSFAIETHLIDANTDLMGKEIAVEFLERMRDQFAFDSPGELRDQILKDIETARGKHARR